MLTNSSTRRWQRCNRSPKLSLLNSGRVKRNISKSNTIMDTTNIKTTNKSNHNNSKPTLINKRKTLQQMQEIICRQSKNNKFNRIFKKPKMRLNNNKVPIRQINKKQNSKTQVHSPNRSLRLKMHRRWKR